VGGGGGGGPVGAGGGGGGGGVGKVVANSLVPCRRRDRPNRRLSPGCSASVWRSEARENGHQKIKTPTGYTGAVDGGKKPKET